MTIQTEKAKIREIKMFNKLDARSGRLSDSVLDIYEISLTNKKKKVKKK